jgi:hypothetical protein
MFQAIHTKYLGPTNHRGARVKATAQAGSVTVAWDYALSADKNHAEAARVLTEKWGWLGVWVMGALPNGDRCHVRPEPLTY